MSAAASAAEGAPSAELLLYLAEFADDQGHPEDPRDVTAEATPDPKDTDRRSNDHEPKPDAVPPAPVPDTDD